jgi:hypothetical protein
MAPQMAQHGMLLLCCLLGAARPLGSGGAPPQRATDLVRAGDVDGARAELASVASLPRPTLGFLLCEAAYRGRAAMTAVLVDAGADVAYVDDTSDSRTPLHYVIAGCARMSL